MLVQVSQSESQAIGLTRDFLLSILVYGTEVIRGQDNRVPEPAGSNFVVMTPIMRKQLETTLTTITSAGLALTAITTRTDLQPTQCTVQLDFHGPAAGDNAQIFTTLFRSDCATTFYAQDPNFPVDVTPLYQSDPRQVPFINGEGQYEERWSIDAELQVNPVVTTQTQSAIAVKVGIIEIDATYKP